MSAAEYYGTGTGSGSGSGGHGYYPPQSQYQQQPPSHGSQQNYLTPYPQQYGRPGSAYSDYAPSSSYRRGSSRAHSADPYRYEKDDDRRGYGSDDDERGRGRRSAGPEGAQNGDRGLGATLVGGGAGGLLGHKLGNGKFGTLLESAVGAIAANVVENKFEKKHNGKHGKKHDNDEHLAYGKYHGHHGSHHSQGSSSGGGLMGRVESFMSGRSRTSSHHGSSSHGSHHGSYNMNDGGYGYSGHGHHRY
ncbi:hypothetical protein DL768_001927 [Monosporascus sp. mg162]|nr:hypothetical protein DL768_001927 [Monosporascus sp. mg162]